MYDAIIVGARCAGAPTAMLLARKGYRVSTGRSGQFPKRHAFHAHPLAARRRDPAALGFVGSTRCDRLPSHRAAHDFRCRSI